MGGLKDMRRLWLSVLAALALIWVALFTVLSFGIGDEPIALRAAVATVLVLAVLVLGVWIGGSTAPPLRTEPWLKTYQTLCVSGLAPVVAFCAAFVAWSGVQQQIKTQQETAQADQRPWVAAELIQDATPNLRTMLFQVKNGGKGPALNACATFFRRTTGPTGLLDGNAFPSKCEGSATFLLPGASRQYPFPLANDIVFPTDKQSWLYVLGFVTYEDNDYVYWTKACWYWEIAFRAITSCSHDNTVGKTEKRHP
jgi:hypothetical protein